MHILSPGTHFPLHPSGTHDVCPVSGSRMMGGMPKGHRTVVGPRILALE